jgi:hypothetical protein
MEALLGKPDRIITSSAADIDCFAEFYQRRSYSLYKVEVSFSNIPRCIVCFISFLETLFFHHIFLPRTTGFLVPMVSAPLEFPQATLLAWNIAETALGQNAEMATLIRQLVRGAVGRRRVVAALRGRFGACPTPY